MKLKPSKKAEPVPEEPSDPSKDRIGTYPKDYDTDALPERRTAAFARIMAIIAGIQAFALVAMGFAIAAIMPLQKIVPMMVTSNKKGDEIVHVNPISLDNPTSDYLTEIALRNYVTKRNSIVASQAEQAVNWGLGSVVQLASTPEVYNAFQQQAQTEYQQMRQNQRIRNVRIDSVRKIDNDTWQVEWVSTDLPDQSALAEGQPSGESHSWVSTYEFKFAPSAVKYSNRLNNPLGLVVTSVSDARRD